MRFGVFAALATVAGALLLGAAAAVAGPISYTYSPAGVQAPNASAICGATVGCTVGYETFSYAPVGSNASYTSNFGSGTGTPSVYTGVYSPVQISTADQYGGAGNTGSYAVVFGSSNTLTITDNATGGGVNYFGIWISAADPGNQLQFYDANGNLLYTYTAQQMTTDLGTCNSGNAGNPYCGNPSYYFTDSSELFAYVNFYDSLGTISKIVFSQIGGGGFESDNQAVAYNTALSKTAEPESLFLMIGGLAGLLAVRRARPAA